MARRAAAAGGDARAGPGTRALAAGSSGLASANEPREERVHLPFDLVVDAIIEAVLELRADGLDRAVDLVSDAVLELVLGVGIKQALFGTEKIPLVALALLALALAPNAEVKVVYVQPTGEAQTS